MKNKTAILGIGVLTLLILSSCSKQSYESNLGEHCIHDSDCKTTMDYLVQSNCPFDSACIDNTCRVVCPFTYHDSSSNISVSYPLECNSDDDCDCSNRINSLDCICHKGACLSIEA